MMSLPRLPTYGAEQRRTPRIDWLLILATLLLMTIGMMSLYSEGITHDGGAGFRKQLLNTFIGLIPFSIFAFTPPQIWNRCVNLVYAFNVVMLGAVLVFGKHINGAERWIQVGPIQFQPSEIAKVLTVITLASFYARRQDSIHKLSTFGLGLLHVSVPLLLILLQPHLGAALVLMVSWFAISLVVGVPSKYLAATVAVVVALAALVVVAPKMKFLPLHSYQMQRVSEMLSSKKDDKGKSWQVERAEIAFAEGGVLGTGYLRGEQKAGHFIPLQSDDFIITVVGEEGGLIGCTLVLAAFGFFFFRLWLIMFQATDLYYKMIVGGLFAALAFHMIVNTAMVLGMLPVVGLWLPFLSYGGSAMWMCLSCVGLALNIRRRERPLLF